MRDIADELRCWLSGSEPFAIAVIVKAWSSAPRPAGTMMAVSATGEVLGSLSGGCVEGAVYELAGDVIADGRARAEHYGVGDGDALAVGLTCGGQLDVLVRRVDPGGEDAAILVEALCNIATGSPCALAVPMETAGAAGGPDRMSLVTPAEVHASAPLRAEVVEPARAALASGSNDARLLAPDSCGDPLLVIPFSPRPRCIIFGAIDYAQALAELASFAGYRVTVCDARSVFATTRRFPGADEVVVDWPHRYLEAQIAAGAISESTVLAVLTHDLKFDIPLLTVALRSNAGYIGALGSRRTTDRRFEVLAAHGLTGAELARLHAPIGLDLGARTPQETAISILAEVVQLRHAATGRQLRLLEGAIHSDPIAAVCAT